MLTQSQEEIKKLHVIKLLLYIKACKRKKKTMIKKLINIHSNQEKSTSSSYIKFSLVLILFKRSHVSFSVYPSIKRFIQKIILLFLVPSFYTFLNHMKNPSSSNNIINFLVHILYIWIT